MNRASYRPALTSDRKAFDHLTHALVLDQFRRGVLPEAVLGYLLAGIGLDPLPNPPRPACSPVERLPIGHGEP